MRRDIKASDVWGLREFAAADPLGHGIVLTMDPRLLNGNASVASVNRAHAYRVMAGGTISKIGLQVITASGNICVGVYANQGSGRNAVPGSLLATSGAVACPAAGWAEVALTGSVTVSPGDWLAVSADNTTAAFGQGASFGASNAYLGLISGMDTAHPLPTTWAATQVGGRAFFLLGT